jgi:hypothetical protein
MKMKRQASSPASKRTGSLTEKTIERELANARRNAILRILAAAEGKPLPPKYKIKLPKMNAAEH